MSKDLGLNSNNNTDNYTIYFQNKNKYIAIDLSKTSFVTLSSNTTCYFHITETQVWS